MGRVVAVDIQKRMLDTAMKRASKRGLEDRIVPVLSDAGTLDIGGDFDFVLTANVLHELPDIEVSCREIYKLLKPGGIFYVTEPAFHIVDSVFEYEISVLNKAGFTEVERPNILGGKSIVLKK